MNPVHLLMNITDVEMKRFTESLSAMPEGFFCGRTFDQ
jgi:hypothetical protein